jgi:hypothetical protein
MAQVVEHYTWKYKRPSVQTLVSQEEEKEAVEGGGEVHLRVNFGTVIISIPHCELVQSTPKSQNERQKEAE